MERVNSLDRAIVYWSFGWLPSDQLPAVALEALEHGAESPSLIQLASADSRPDPHYHGLFQRSLTELGRVALTKTEAGRRIAREYAEMICNGEAMPIDGAKMIWRVSLECQDLTQELGIFGGRVTEYEGMPTGKEQISALILSEAKELLSAGGGGCTSSSN